MTRAEKVVAAARACLGARFRVHGRDPQFGLDCVGVVAVAFGRTVTADYAPRGGDAARIEARIRAAGFIPAEPARAGDLLLIDADREQWHLGVRTPAGFIHADAGLRRVVETPGLPAGLRSAWAEAM
jgi:murein DD-endopeptidase / murein LD-carboxypeptidase